MIQLPDFKEKQIIFISSKDYKLIMRANNLALVKNEKIVNKLIINKIFVIFVQGEATFTTQVIKKCLNNGISIFFIKDNFEHYAAFAPMTEGNYILRDKQYHFNDEINFSKNLIKNKYYNQLCTLMEQKENKLSKAKIKILIKEFDDKLCKIDSNKEILGMEGSFSKDFFQKYFSKIDWYRRMPRAKCDINNILLDIGYTYLFNFIDSILRLHGFDTYKGIYHKLFFQRKSLSCDIMEPFRYIIDKALLKAYNLKQINKKDFKFEKDKFSLSYDKQKTYTEIFLKAIMERKEDIFKYIKEFYFCILNDKKDYPFFKCL